jgi:hypothetical protein
MTEGKPQDPRLCCVHHLSELPQLAEVRRPYIETCIAAFGPERAMFESNFPVDKGSCGYAALWNAFKRITADCSAAEKAALFAGTRRNSTSWNKRAVIQQGGGTLGYTCHARTHARTHARARDGARYGRHSLAAQPRPGTV